MAIILFNTYVLFPMPEGMDMNDPEAMNAYVAGRIGGTFPVTCVRNWNSRVSRAPEGGTPVRYPRPETCGIMGTSLELS